MNFTRYNSTKVPRFLKTIAETSKPPLTKSKVVNKPFGLPVPILLNPKSNSKRSLRNEFLGSEAKEMRQRQLDHDIKHSPFYESKSFTNTNGKIFSPPISYFKADKSLFFPNFNGNVINGNETQIHKLFKDKVSLVRVFSTVSGEKCTETYFKSVDGVDYLKDYEQFEQVYPKAQVIDINIPIGWAKRLVVSLAKPGIKKSLPVSRQNTYFVLPDSLFSYDIKAELNCDNSCSGYIYLVDSEGRIRWATSGYASDSEKELLYKCLSGVTKELV
ncbi:hypothetical protein CANTEDRAFT_112077 [Yamadazyma tenuis ATCC 10573]|uniref:Mitochondrial ATPase complex subunit ATP10 n=1 Tax=Candida tenuis (strain ATCC 10573 / BCRC 21748 / CBS 615 / JCM 9827 / NBRC 10315 / NRRL Y-1498 / VKM Y-70) TaxID=590646 RepID=G3AXB1_CANTC|nr:uncharacterized protein CANTEDRAFT_112077 [Yamadazyma tenuis ATCC 10573]EGV66329.1 hypothetical protein CANTEDRAFT_112077 [Yamadazyma tenuis ATCC 10573]